MGVIVGVIVVTQALNVRLPRMAARNNGNICTQKLMKIGCLGEKTRATLGKCIQEDCKNLMSKTIAGGSRQRTPAQPREAPK